MNRLASLLGVDEAEDGIVGDGAVREGDPALRVEKRRRTAHASFTPLHYERNYAYPLLIWLHGSNDNELQLHKVMPHISLRNYVGIGPRGTRAMDGDAAPHTYAWHQCIGDIDKAEDAVAECLEAARVRFHVSPQRVFLAGYETGGTMALRLAFRRPEWFAGVASINGPFPFGGHPLLQVNDARRVPVLLSHGRDSMLYSEDRICEDLRLMHAAGIVTTLRQYPCDDDLTTQMLADLDRWIMERVTGSNAHTEPVWEGTPGWNHRN